MQVQWRIQTHKPDANLPAFAWNLQGLFFRLDTMTKTYAQIVEQIEVLKQNAEKVRRKEVEGVVGRIRDAIAAYNLTAEDLGFGSKPKRAGKAAAPVKSKGRKATKTARVIKFRNDSGGAWVGRGKRPQWLRDALASGKTLADFAVK
jgi:DNA-binding protein H-NS